MNAQKPTAIFFHGLNTFGDDLLHLGPVTLGRMDLHLKSELENRGLRLLSIEKIGSGSPEDQADRALKQLMADPEIPTGASLHLLGQSMGGLVARVVAHRLRTETEVNLKRLVAKNLISSGTPHRGTVAAGFAMEFAKKNPALCRGLKTIGYSMDKNSETFRHYTPQALDVFNLKYPEVSSTPEHSLICAVPLRSVSRYFLSLYGTLHGVGRLEMIQRLISSQDGFAPSDGFIPVGSQNWGHAHGPYGLDHFAQMGYFSHFQTNRQSTASRLEFQRFCDDIAEIIKT